MANLSPLRKPASMVKESDMSSHRIPGVEVDGVCGENRLASWEVPAGRYADHVFWRMNNPGDGLWGSRKGPR